MCGRYALVTSETEVRTLFDITGPIEVAPRYNIAPTQPVGAVVAQGEAGGRRWTHFYWGLVPPWADDPSIGNRLINARAESAPQKPAFRHAFRRRRCLLPASGFYEWHRPEKKGRFKQPYYITAADEGLFAMAGIWEHWMNAEGNELDSCAILTTDANDMMRPIHHRMPVILPPEHWQAWLDPGNEDTGALSGLLGPYPSELMLATPVSTHVNSPRHEDPKCIAPMTASDGEEGTLFG